MTILKEKAAGECLTIIIRDNAPLIFANSTPTYRTVRVRLTEDQQNKIRLKHTGTLGGDEVWEEVSQCILEPMQGGRGDER